MIHHFSNKVSQQPLHFSVIPFFAKNKIPAANAENVRHKRQTITKGIEIEYKGVNLYYLTFLPYMLELFVSMKKMPAADVNFPLHLLLLP